MTFFRQQVCVIHPKYPGVSSLRLHLKPGYYGEHRHLQNLPFLSIPGDYSELHAFNQTNGKPVDLRDQAWQRCQEVGN